MCHVTSRLYTSKVIVQTFSMSNKRCTVKANVTRTLYVICILEAKCDVFWIERCAASEPFAFQINKRCCVHDITQCLQLHYCDNRHNLLLSVFSN